MTVYTNLIATALRLITRFGQTVQVRTYTDGTLPDANYPWEPATGTSSDQSTVGVILDFRPDQVEGYAYQRGDKLCYIPASGLTGEITEKMTIVDAEGGEWAIISASRVAPSAEDILWQLYIRKWPRRSK